MEKTITKAHEIHEALQARGYAHGSYSFMGAASIHCCEIRVAGYKKVRGTTWEAALEALAVEEYSR